MKIDWTMLGIIGLVVLSLCLGYTIGRLDSPIVRPVHTTSDSLRLEIKHAIVYTCGTEWHIEAEELRELDEEVSR